MTNLAASPLQATLTNALQGVIRAPGDKSISHRALILSALSVGHSHIAGLLTAGDVTKTIDARIAAENVIKDPYGTANGGVAYGYFSGNNCVVGMLGRTSIYGHHTTHELKLYTCLKLNEPIVITTLTLY